MPAATTSIPASPAPAPRAAVQVQVPVQAVAAQPRSTAIWTTTFRSEVGWNAAWVSHHARIRRTTGQGGKYFQCLKAHARLDMSLAMHIAACIPILMAHARAGACVARRCGMPHAAFDTLPDS